MKSDKELFKKIKEKLFTPVVGDVMDRMGRRNQFLPPRIHPLREDMTVAGRAMPVLEADIFSDQDTFHRNAVLERPFGLMLEALDALKPHEVYICSGSSRAYALWGENMSLRAQRLGAAGAVMHGYSRDTRGILELNFPTFSLGRYAKDQAPRGKVIDYRVPIQIEQVSITPGDIIFGDRDGVCIIPQEIEEAVFEEAFHRVQGENKVKQALQAGMSAVEAFERYGIM